MKGYEQYGNHGQIVDNEDKVVGYYKTIGLDMQAISFIKRFIEVPASSYVWTWRHLEEVVDMLDLHLVPEFD